MRGHDPCPDTNPDEKQPLTTSFTDHAIQFLGTPLHRSPAPAPKQKFRLLQMAELSDHLGDKDYEYPADLHHNDGADIGVERPVTAPHGVLALDSDS